MRNRGILTVLVLSLLLGLSPLAADSVIRRGIDIFTTPADGRTYYDFARNPIPAGFFCKRSKAFTGRVVLKGLPLTTETPGQLWGADTVVERLDDAAFDANGTAVTRLQFRALSLVSIDPIRTACGAFHVYVSLGGRQRVTTMSIYRTKEGGGSFSVPLAIDARLSFIPVKKPAKNKSARKLELTGTVNFPAHPISWSFPFETRTQRIGSVRVDTNGDLTPDTLLPGTSNFSPGVSPDRPLNKSWWGECPSCCEMECHTSDGEQHCYCAGVPPGCLMPPIC
ncbi:MAG TPA: hypothetical protein VF756_13520 [Thermoanaerobaculia bacterium]